MESKQIRLWKQQVNVQLQSFFAFHSDATISSTDRDSWRFTGFYGHSEIARHKESWSLLEILSTQSIRPWLVAGDFNEVLHQKEKSGTCQRPQWQLTDFLSCWEKCGLADLSYDGLSYTWCNHRQESFTVRVRLDRRARLQIRRTYSQVPGDSHPMFGFGSCSYSDKFKPRRESSS
ncbi:UNVERIFIED_CONTAM: hypothetical protein Slati_2399000 [Sesamum latifolium]|uniref:Endonuclease/exonuclease/phosphatase domain-containing protein n=1 Tax=Sesamum latifolium TaxID=2727402 RepID=A0AAW2WD18_9LAMI